MHGSTATASFFAPWDQIVEPYIRVTTGDYASERRNRGRDNALAGFLNSVAHEVIHYQQWVATGEITERGIVVRARNMVDRYALTTDHPIISAAICEVLERVLATERAQRAIHVVTAGVVA